MSGAGWMERMRPAIPRLGSHTASNLSSLQDLHQRCRAAVCETAQDARMSRVLCETALNPRLSLLCT